MISNRNKWLGWGGAALLVATVLVYVSWPEPLIVQTVVVNRGLVEQTVANTRVGTVKACNRSRLSPAIGGRVAQLYVDEGHQVEAGQLLLELWNDDRKAQLDQAQAMVVFAESEKNRFCLTADADQREAERVKGLAKKNLASQEQADKLDSHAKASHAACVSATAKVQESKASVHFVEAALEQTYLRAPFAGIVAEVTGEVGEFTTPSPPGVATPPAIDLLTNDCHYVIAPIDEVDAANITLDMPVRITMDAFQNKHFSGKVQRVAAYVLDLEKQARTVDVEVTYNDESEVPLIAGYSADVEVVLAVRENTLRIPTEAVREDGTALVLNEDGVIELRDVSVGIKNWRFTEILSGLIEGEQVVLAFGQEGVVAGASAVADTGN